VLLWTIVYAPTGVNQQGNTVSNVIPVLIIACFFTPIAYMGFCYRFNTNTVIAKKDMINFAIKPLPYSRSKMFNANIIQQFYVGKDMSGKSISYGVLNCVDNDGTVHDIAAIFPSSNAAFQVCHELMDFYGLEEKEIYGHTNLPHHPGIRPVK
jgi:hypothetical protein